MIEQLDFLVLALLEQNTFATSIIHSSLVYKGIDESVLIELYRWFYEE